MLVEPRRSDEVLIAPGSSLATASTTGAEESGWQPLAPSRFRTARQILRSWFCLAQVTVNVVLSLVFPMGFLWVIFSPHSFISTTTRYAWNDSTPMGVVLASPWAGTFISCGTLPVALPDALDNGWFGLLPAQSVRRVSCVLPFLRPRLGIVRHLLIGTLAALFFIPAGFAVFRYVVGPVMSAETLIVACAMYISSIPIFVVPLGLLGFGLPKNFERVQVNFERTNGGHPLCRTLKRILISPTC